MPFEDETMASMRYSLPAQLLRSTERCFSVLTANRRRVKATVIFGRNLPADRQHTDNNKWQHYVQIEFDRQLPSISWRRMGFFNEFLLLTEESKLLIGACLVEISTDHPDRLDPHQLTLALCKTFNWTLQDYTANRRDLD